MEDDRGATTPIGGTPSPPQENAIPLSRPQLTPENTSLDGIARTSPGRTARTRVFHLVDQYHLFADTDGTPYVSLPAINAGVPCFEMYAIRSAAASRRIRSLYHEKYNHLVSSQALKDGIDSLEAEAHKSIVAVGLRTMSFERGFALDLVDRSWTKIIVSPGSWRCANEIRPRFRREAGMLPLPMPVGGGNINKLRRYLNIQDDASYSLLLGWLVHALQPKGPYPILVMQGEHGSSKSTAARIIASLIDPNLAPLIGVPKSERDLMVIARSRHILAFDNASVLNSDIKDALCRLATGGGFASRKLYSDADTVVWNACRPIIINGVDNLLVADDLADRAIGLTLNHIPDSQRMRESDIMREFEAERFEILGAALDASAHALSVHTVPVNTRLSRMADFAHFAASAACAWGVTYDLFLDQYRGNRQEAIERGLDSDIVARAIRWLMATEAPWEGTWIELLRKVRNTPDLADQFDSFPLTARALSIRLRRLAPGLRAVGIMYSELGRTGRGYRLRIDRELDRCDALSVLGERSILWDGENEKGKKATEEATQSARSTQSAHPDGPPDRGLGS